MRPPPDRHERLVPRRARRAVLGLVVASAVVVIGFGLRFHGDGSGTGVDRALAGLVDLERGPLTTWGRPLVVLVGPAYVLTLLLALAVLAWLLRGVRGLALMLVGPAAAMATTSLLLKPLVGRRFEGALAFPSGHTTSVASCAAAAALLVLGMRSLPRVLRAVAVVGAVAVTAVVGATLVGLDAHYPTDTVGGLAVALAVVPAAALLVDAAGDALAARLGRRPVRAQA